MESFLIDVQNKFVDLPNLSKDVAMEDIYVTLFDLNADEFLVWNTVK